MAWASLYSGLGMRRTESMITMHSVDVSLKSSPMLRSVPRGGTFFKSRLRFEHSQSYYAGPHPGGAGDPVGDHIGRDADRFRSVPGRGLERSDRRVPGQALRHGDGAWRLS